MSKIILRKFDPGVDSGLIYSSYAKGVFHGSTTEISTPKAEWFKDFHQKVGHQLDNAKVYIACLEDDPSTIIGYSIVENDELQFVYVKEVFRNKGIATLLTKNKYKTINQGHITRVAQAILEKYQKEKNEAQ